MITADYLSVTLITMACPFGIDVAVDNSSKSYNSVLWNSFSETLNTIENGNGECVKETTT